nr:MAG: YopX protein [Bacteriophage sp.]
MEDRYLSKAKRLDNGEWEVGSLIALPTGEYEISNKCNNPPDCDPMWDKVVITHKVDPSTICQCTGLKDKNGKLIWENDIVKINNSKGNVLITFGDFEIICTIPNEKYYKHRLEYDTEYEVVGSVFDNPELLESEG